MPRRDTPRSGSGIWRVAALTVAAVLGLLALWLVVFSTSAKQTQIGVLLGAWAIFLAAPSVFGSRRAQHAAQLRETRLQAEELYDAQLELRRVQQEQLELARTSQQAQELELRRLGEMQLSREAAARREADFRLEVGLRGEVERVLAQHIGELRDEIAALRAEVVEKVNGQLWLERVETTRVIASDLEALQSELRRLATQDRVSLTERTGQLAAPTGNVNGSATHGWPAQAPEEHLPVRNRVDPTPTPTPTSRPAVDANRVDAASGDASIVDAELVEPEPLEPEPLEPEPVVAEPAAPEARDGERPQPLVDPLVAPPLNGASLRETAGLDPSVPEPPTGGGSSLGHDAFAGLPRLSPLPDDVAGLLEPDDGPDDGPDHEPAPQAIPDARAGDAARYVGRRRAAGEQPLDVPEPAGRRRAPVETADDLVARIRRQ